MDTNFEEVNWGNIDRSQNPERYIEFLKEVSNTQWARESKQYSYQAIHPQEGDQILDLGCGIGIDVDALAEYVGATGTVIGVDNSESMIEAARSRYGDSDRENVRFVVDDAVALSFESDTFDRSRIDRVLQHVSSPENAIQELKRVTRSGGLVWVAEPDWETYVVDMPNSEIANQIMAPQWGPVRHPTIGRKLYRLFSDAGFENIEVNSYSTTIGDAEKADLSFRFKTRLKSMIDSGSITAAEAEQWLARLDRTADNDQFLAAGSAFTVGARVP